MKLQRQSGFTTVEIILYVGLTTLILGAVATFYSMILQSRIRNETVAEVDQQGIMAMQMMTQSIRNATASAAPIVGGSGVTLSLTATDSAKNPTIFSLNNGTLQMQEGTTTALPLTTSRVIASNLTFTNLSRASSSASVRIQYTITHRNPTSTYNYNYSQTFYGTASLRKWRN